MRRLITVLILVFAWTDPADAKTVDVMGLLSGLFEPGDSIQGPLAAAPPATTPPPVQALKYGGANAVSVNFAPAAPAPAPGQSSGALPAAPAARKKAAEEDPADDLLDLGLPDQSAASAPSLRFGSSSATEIHAVSQVPSTGGKTSVAYTTDMSALRSELNSPATALAYMQSNFKYSAHGTDTPYSPEQLDSLRVGDCKDFATFFSWAIADDGYDCSEYVFEYGKNLGHVVTIYNGGDGHWYVQTNLNSLGPVASVDDALNTVQKYDLPAGSYVGKYKVFPAGYTGQMGYE